VALPAGQPALTILCLDNDAMILQGLTALLAGWGHRPILAADAETAIAAAKACPPDVVLLDYHLDGVSTGLDFLDQLRHSCRSAVRALVITGDRSEAVRKAAKARGCEVLFKPVKPAALRRFLSGEVFSLQLASNGDQQSS
jgi:CheY-like chemotaxis protein